MKLFFSYLKYNLKWIMLFVANGAILWLLLFLNQIPGREMGYGLTLCLVFLLSAIAIDFYDYQKKYHRLRELESVVKVSLENMPEPRGMADEAYQDCLKVLFSGKTELENDAVRRERDLMEYYSMWVHQIKTPISALKLLLQEERPTDQTASGEELQELFRIEQYVEMALQYTRLGSESTDFVFKKVDLDEVIRDAVRKYARQFVHKKISLNYESVEEKVVTDAKWLGFVVEQLLSNAIKYTPKGSISIYMKENFLVIEDTGIGVRAEDLPRICEKGYTGYNGHANQRSTGIGLYLCSSILKKLGHGLTITSEEGVGTKVSIGFDVKK